MEILDGRVATVSGGDFEAVWHHVLVLFVGYPVSNAESPPLLTVVFADAEDPTIEAWVEGHISFMRRPRVALETIVALSKIVHARQGQGFLRAALPQLSFAVASVTGAPCTAT